MRNLKRVRIALAWGLLAACLVAASPSLSVATAGVVPIGQWNTMNSANAEDLYLTYQFAADADLPLTVSWQFRPTSYVPSYTGPGYIMQGSIGVMHGASWEASVLFEMAKATWVEYVQDWHTNVRLFGYDATGPDILTTKSGGFIPGELYTGTMVWDRDTSTIDITVAWSGGEYTKTVNSSGADVTGLSFYNTGFDSWGIGWSSFGNVVVTVPEPATMGLLGLGLAGLIARRRKQRA